MSLDVSLILGGSSKNGSGIFIRDSGSIREVSLEEWHEKFPNTEPVTMQQEDDHVYWGNITHNLTPMAKEVDLYKYLWRPEEANITHAKQLIRHLERGLETLRGSRDRFEKFNPKNGWGDYDGLVEFTEAYLNACYKYPQAEIYVSR